MTNNTNNKNHNDIHMVVPFTKGLSESLKKIHGKVGIHVLLKVGNAIIKSPLAAFENKDNTTQKSGLICRYKSAEEYIGKSARTFGERFKVHLCTPSAIYDNAYNSGHHTKLDNFSIVGR